MAKKIKTNLLDLAVEDLNQLLADEKSRLKKMKFNHAVTPLENPLLLRGSRREVARLLTEVNRRKAVSETK